jgi:hypothetical protein
VLYKERPPLLKAARVLNYPLTHHHRLFGGEHAPANLKPRRGLHRAGEFLSPIYFCSLV